MKVLYIGNDNITNIVEAVKKRYTSLDAEIAKTMKEIKYLVKRGDVIDRVLVFDSILMTMCDIGNTQELRLCVQNIINVLKEGNTIEIVCIAQSDVTGQFFLEELYEIMHNSAVYVVGKQLSVTDIMTYSIQNIAQLRQTSKKTIALDVYQTDDSVIWSDSKAVVSDWQQLGKPEFVGQEFVDKFRLSIALEILDFYIKTASWEYKKDLLDNTLPVNTVKLLNNKKNIIQRIIDFIKLKFNRRKSK